MSHEEVEASVSIHSELKSTEGRRGKSEVKSRTDPVSILARGLSRKVPGIRENGLEVGKKLTASFHLKGIIKAHKTGFRNKIRKGCASEREGRTQRQFSEVTELCHGTKSGLQSLCTGKGRAHHSEPTARP